VTFWRLLRRQDGITLLVAVGILGVLSVASTTMVYYTSTNARSAEYSADNTSAYELAEAGIDQMMAILSKPENNALLPGLLPETTYEYDDGSVTWSGALDPLTQTWAISSTGRVKNPTGLAASDVTRTLSAKVPVTPTLTQPLNNPAWNYIFSTKTGSDCDMSVSQNVSGSSRLYVEGNLCLLNNAGITAEALIVKGNLNLSNNAYVGSSSSMSTRIETYVGGNCKYGNGSWGACSGNQDARRIYSKRDGPGWVIGVNSTVPVIAAPESDYPGWYANAIPGPAIDCSSANGAKSGTTPVWDNDGVRNSSVSSIFDLTPASSYTCRVGSASNPTGELSWNASTKTLTVAGTMFIDGSAKIDNGALNQYNGQATLYLSGTLLIGNNTKLCGGVSGSNCDFAAWNPNTEMFTIVTNGSGGQAGTGNGILVSQNAAYQGGLFAAANVTYQNNARSDGPIVGWEIVFVNNVTNYQFPTITTVPVGMPGNPTVYAQPNAPQLYSG
jgi:hypothetical protein